MRLYSQHGEIFWQAWTAWATFALCLSLKIHWKTENSAAPHAVCPSPGDCVAPVSPSPVEYVEPACPSPVATWWLAAAVGGVTDCFLHLHLKGRFSPHRRRCLDYLRWASHPLTSLRWSLLLLLHHSHLWELCPAFPCGWRRCRHCLGGSRVSCGDHSGGAGSSRGAHSTGTVGGCLCRRARGRGSCTSSGCGPAVAISNGWSAHHCGTMGAFLSAFQCRAVGAIRCKYRGALAPPSLLMSVLGPPTGAGPQAPTSAPAEVGLPSALLPVSWPIQPEAMASSSSSTGTVPAPRRFWQRVPPRRPEMMSLLVH